MDVDKLWQGVLDALRELAPVEVKVSRFAPKPALWLHGREIAHWEAPGVIDLRLTTAGWMQMRAEFGEDPAVTRDSSRRDWIELRGGAADAARLRPLLAAAVEHNGG